MNKRCFDNDKLINYIEDNFESINVNEFEEHILDCDVCTEKLRKLKKAQSVLDSAFRIKNENKKELDIFDIDNIDENTCFIKSLGKKYEVTIKKSKDNIYLTDINVKTKDLIGKLILESEKGIILESNNVYFIKNKKIKLDGCSNVFIIYIEI